MTSKKLVVAAIQISSASDIQRNIELAEMLIDQAVDEGAQLVLLPENFAQIPSSKIKRQQAYEAIGSGPIQEFLATKSEQKSIYLVAGSVAIASEHSHKAFSASLCFDPNGDLLARYNKIHLFDVQLPSGESYRESNTVEAGDKAMIGSLSWGNVGMSVCYDLRFPHLYRDLAKAGADILAVPSAFTEVTGTAHWHLLLRSRAVENACFVMAPAQGGAHANGRKTYGHSLIVSPWGEVLAEAGTEPGIIKAELNLEEIRSVRARLPSLEHDRDYVSPGVGA